jgi:hypothetical protein
LNRLAMIVRSGAELGDAMTSDYSQWSDSQSSLGSQMHPASVNLRQ